MRLTVFAFMGLGMIMISNPLMAQNVNSVESRLDRIERDMQTLSRSVFRGDVPPPSISVSGNSVDTQQAAQMEIRMTQIEEQLRRLTGMIEENSFRLRQLSNTSGTAANTLNTSSQTFGTSNYVNDSASVMTNTATQIPNEPQPYSLGTIGGVTGMSPARLYDQAFSHLQTNDFASAQGSFEEFIRAYPDHSLSANAKYWLGETFYARSEYQEAARAFARSFKDHPDGQKAPDTLLRLAMSLRGQGMTDEACLTLSELNNRFPNAPASVKTQASQERQTYGCG